MQDEQTDAKFPILERQLSAVRKIGEVLASSIGLDSVFKSIIQKFISLFFFIFLWKCRFK